MTSEKMTLGNFDLTQIKGIESGMVTDLKKYDKVTKRIESAKVVQVPSQYSETGKQWVLKVESECVESYQGVEGTVEFRASELFNLVQDENDGTLKGFPKGEGSNLIRFLKDIGIKQPEKLNSLQEIIESMVGKSIIIKAYEKNVDGKSKTYLKFRY